MPYFMLFLNRLWWMIQNLLMFHLQMLSVYFQGLSVWIEGDRVTGVYIEQSSYTAYRKDKMEEHMGTDEDAEAEEMPSNGDEDDGTAA